MQIFAPGHPSEFARLPSWLSHVGALLSGLSIIISLIFGYLTVVSLSFTSVLGVVLVIWCFAIGRRLAIAFGKSSVPSPLTFGVTWPSIDAVSDPVPSVLASGPGMAALS